MKKESAREDVKGCCGGCGGCSHQEKDRTKLRPTDDGVLQLTEPAASGCRGLSGAAYDFSEY